MTCASCGHEITVFDSRFHGYDALYCDELTPEAARKYSRFHPRCGTSFMFVMILLGVLSGANVVMPNITPSAFARNYTIYDNKKYHDSESAAQLEKLEKRLKAIDRHIDYGRGDYMI